MLRAYDFSRLKEKSKTQNIMYENTFMKEGNFNFYSTAMGFFVLLFHIQSV